MVMHYIDNYISNGMREFQQVISGLKRTNTEKKSFTDFFLDQCSNSQDHQENHGDLQDQPPFPYCPRTFGGKENLQIKNASAMPNLKFKHNPMNQLQELKLNENQHLQHLLQQKQKEIQKLSEYSQDMKEQIIQLSNRLQSKTLQAVQLNSSLERQRALYQELLQQNQKLKRNKSTNRNKSNVLQTFESRMKKDDPVSKHKDLKQRQKDHRKISNQLSIQCQIQKNHTHQCLKEFVQLCKTQRMSKRIESAIKQMIVRLCSKDVQGSQSDRTSRSSINMESRSFVSKMVEQQSSMHQLPRYEHPSYSPMQRIQNNSTHNIHRHAAPQVSRVSLIGLCKQQPRVSLFGKQQPEKRASRSRSRKKIFE